VQVTDARAQSGSIHGGSDRSPFNADSTLFIARTDGEIHLWIFNTVYYFITDNGLLETPECDLAYAVWSRIDPQVLYCVGSGFKLFSFNVANRSATQMFDFEPLFPGTSFQPSLSVDDSDTKFVFIASAASQDTVVAYDHVAGTVNSLDFSGALEGASISRSGTHAAVRYPSGLGFWNLAAETVFVPADDTARGDSCGPPAYTDAMHFAWDCNAGVIARDLAAPLPWRDVFRPPNLAGFPNFDNELSVSLNQADQSFVIVGVSNQTELNAGWDPYQSEIVAVATDGSWLVRLAHHHSAVTIPYPAISYDGRFVMFTSNWDTRHQDVFILVMPGLCP
jgi:hypothetical protein